MRRQALILLALTGLMWGIATPPGARAQSSNTAVMPGSASTAGQLSARSVPPASSVLVSSVTVDRQDSGETYVDISTSRNAGYRVNTLTNPSRLVVDFDDAENTCRKLQYAADSPVLKDVRVAQFRVNPSTVRVVADLNGNPVFDVHSTAAGVRIELRPRGTGNGAPLASIAPASVSKPVATLPAKPEVVKTTAASAALPPVAKPTLTPQPRPEVAKAVSSAIVPAPATKPPVVPQSKPELAKTATAVMPQSKSQEVGPVKATLVSARVEPATPVTTEVQSTLPVNATSKQVVAAVAPIPPSVTPETLRARQAAQILRTEQDASAAQGTVPVGAVAPPEEPRPVYTGEPISVNFKDVDIKDFFREIHEISGLNIIVDPNVSGSVTLVLDSVPWDQALDIVLKNNRLGRVMEGNVLRIARLETLAAEQQDQLKLADARVNAAPLVTVFRPINYAKAQEIAALLKTWAGGGALSKRGTVLVDQRNNTLIISDIQSQVPIILNILSKIDKRAKQVSIEARIVLATADFTRTLASSLAGGFTNRNTTIGNGATGTGSSISIPVPTTIGGGALPTVTSTGAVASGFGVASITNAGANYFINAALSAAEERDQAKTISRPSIVTQNNVTGSVQQGVQVPIQTSINNTISVQYENATLQMQVTPQVTDDNNIFLIINVNNASIGAAVFQAGPSINTQQATTSVLVPDGGTVVFGGITVTSRSKTANYIPLLGSIPIVGNLFKSSNVSDQDQELLFFVTPKIIPG